MVITKTILSLQGGEVAQQVGHERRYIYVGEAKEKSFGLIKSVYPCKTSIENVEPSLHQNAINEKIAKVTIFFR